MSFCYRNDLPGVNLFDNHQCGDCKRFFPAYLMPELVVCQTCLYGRLHKLFFSGRHMMVANLLDAKSKTDDKPV